jgi:hypothetical protein
MRKLILSTIAATLVALTPSVADAQVGYWYGNTRVVPYVTPFSAPYPGGYTTRYVNPWGYQSYYNVQTVPTPYGFNAYETYGVRHRPVYQGPYHSVYWDPYLNNYRYAPGYFNAPRYSYRYWY